MTEIHAGPPRRPSARLVLSLAILAEIAFLLLIPRYLTVDGSGHVGGAALIRDILQGTGDLHLRYVEITPYPTPNLLAGLMLTIAMLVVDPATAERVLQVAYVVAVPLSLLYAVRGIRADRDWLALAAIPLTFTFAFQYGFYDFSFGVALFLVASGYAWRHRVAPGWRAATVFGVLALLVYLTHLVPFLELGLFAAVIGGARVVRSWRTAGSGAGVRTTFELLPLLIAATPSIVLAVIFLLRTSSAAPVDYLDPLLQAIGVVGLAIGLATTHPFEIVAAVALALTLAGLLVTAVWQRARARPRSLHESDALFVYAGAALLVALIAPASVQSGGSYIPERLALFPVYGLVLWLAAQPIPFRVAQVAGAMFVVVAATLLVLRLPTTLKLSGVAQEVESVAPCIAVRSTLIQVNLALPAAGPLARTDPGGAETGRIAAATRGHDLSGWEGHFPFYLYRNRPENDPFLWLLTDPDGFNVPPGVDVEAFRRRPDGEVDYVIVMGRPDATPETLASAGWASLRAQLESSYDRVAVSASGHVEAWERRDPTLADEGLSRRSATNAMACHPGAVP